MSERFAEAQAVAEQVAREAGALVMQGYRSGTRAQKKGAIDLVTEYDVASEKLIVERLTAALPDIGIVAEEAHGPWQGTAPDAQALTWYVDPIDGTTNFAHGHPFFGVSLGLCRGAQPVVGVIFAPALDVLWSGRAGHGVLRNGVVCSVSDCDSLADSLLATGFPYDRATSADNNFAEFTHFKLRARGVRRCGAACLDLAFVADGTYDGYWEYKLNPWDLAAGAALIGAAGGKVTAFDGTALSLASGALVGSNGRIHDALVSGLSQVRKGRPAPTKGG